MNSTVDNLLQQYYSIIKVLPALNIRSIDHWNVMEAVVKTSGIPASKELIDLLFDYTIGINSYDFIIDQIKAKNLL